MGYEEKIENMNLNQIKDSCKEKTIKRASEWVLPLLVVHLSLFIASGWSQETKTTEKKSTAKKEKSIMLTLETSMGNILCKLFEKEAPITVANFIGLAEGSKESTDPNTGQKVKKKFYDGLIFHRVIPNFMIQGGCPLGTGTSGPGYQFQDEIVSTLKFERPGLLAMANAGPGTNGSQFFITTVPTPWLTGKHTIFGEVIQGQDVVEKIGNVATGPGDKPATPVIIKRVKVEKTK